MVDLSDRVSCARSRHTRVYSLGCIHRWPLQILRALDPSNGLQYSDPWHNIPRPPRRTNQYGGHHSQPGSKTNIDSRYYIGRRCIRSVSPFAIKAINSPICLSSTLDRLTICRNFGVDMVDIYVGPTERRFHIHKDLLCSRVPYFEKMFKEGGFIESTSQVRQPLVMPGEYARRRRLSSFFP